MALPTARRIERITDVRVQMHNDDVRWRGMWITMAVFTLVIAAIAYGTAPETFSIALVALVMACSAAFLRPTVGVYLIVFLTLAGDTETTPWWPFTKNMSSRESILYVNDQLILSPLEVLLGVTLLAWVLRRFADRTWSFHRGRMLWPVVVFTVFVLFGLVQGRISGGDQRAAIFEARALLYLPILYVLITNLLRTRAQYRRLLLVAMVSVAVQSIFALLYYRGLSTADKESLESLGDHPVTLQMDVLFVYLIALLVFRCPSQLRWAMGVLAVPVGYAFILSQRRAAMVALVVGVIVLSVVLFHRRRRMFWFFTPTLAVLTTGLVLATWNASGAVGLPAQAVKTVLFPDQLGEAERGSDAYRITESYDLWYTINSSRVTGLGFGRPFYQPIPLPDISFFEFAAYLPHNSVLWIWIKMGFLGFVAMFFMIGRAVQLGGRAAVTVRSDEQAAVIVAGVSFVAMFIVFAYVDIAWGARSMIFLAFAFACCADLIHAADDAAPAVDGVHRHQLDSVAS